MKWNRDNVHFEHFIQISFGHQIQQIADFGLWHTVSAMQLSTITTFPLNASPEIILFRDFHSAMVVITIK